MNRINQLSIKNSEIYVIEKRDQSTLKGLLWGACGISLAGPTLSLTASTVVGVALAALAALSISINDITRNTIGGAVPVVGTLSLVALLANYIAIRITGRCFSNSIYHLSPNPTIQLIKRESLIV